MCSIGRKGSGGKQEEGRGQESEERRKWLRADPKEKKLLLKTLGIIPRNNRKKDFEGFLNKKIMQAMFCLPHSVAIVDKFKGTRVEQQACHL